MRCQTNENSFKNIEYFAYKYYLIEVKKDRERNKTMWKSYNLQSPRERKENLPMNSIWRFGIYICLSLRLVFKMNEIVGLVAKFVKAVTSASLVVMGADFAELGEEFDEDVGSQAVLLSVFRWLSVAFCVQCPSILEFLKQYYSGNLFPFFLFSSVFRA